MTGTIKQAVCRTLLAFGVLVTPGEVFAQSCVIGPGDTVRVTTVPEYVTTDDSGRSTHPSPFQGVLGSWTASALTIITDGETMVLPASAIESAQGLCGMTDTPGQDGLVRGSMLGAGAGLIGGLVFSFTCSAESIGGCAGNREGAQTIRLTLIGVAGGGILGGLFGSMWGSLQGERRWVSGERAPG